MKLFGALLLCSLALVGCTQPQGFQGTATEAGHPVQAACLDRQMPGASSPAFCSCLAKEASYATQNDRAQLERLATLTLNTASTDPYWQSSRTTRNSFFIGQRNRTTSLESLNAWRVTLQNSNLRCEAYAEPEAKKDGVYFFGFSY